MSSKLGKIFLNSDFFYVEVTSLNSNGKVNNITIMACNKGSDLVRLDGVWGKEFLDKLKLCFMEEQDFVSVEESGNWQEVAIEYKKENTEKPILVWLKNKNTNKAGQFELSNQEIVELIWALEKVYI